VGSLVHIGLNLPLFGLVLCRGLGIVVAAPIFSNATIPVRVKAAVTLLIGMVLFPIAVQCRGELPTHAFGYLPLMLTEAGMGLIMGLSGAMVIAGLQAAGGLMAQQIGLRLAQTVSPENDGDSSAISVFLGILGLLLFLSVDGHHWFIQALALSYRQVPLGEVAWGPPAAASVLDGFSNLMVTAVRVAAPLVGIMFLVSVMIALLAKCVPEMNILMVGYPVKVFIGLVALTLTLPLILPVMRDAFHTLYGQLTQLAHWI